MDKQWARKYILDPLNEPEPSQDCGPGTSFYNPERSSLYKSKPASSGSSDKSKPPTHIHIPSHQGETTGPADIKLVVTPPEQSRSGYPTPPGSGSPNQEGSLHSTNPYRSSSSSKPSLPGISPPNSPQRDGSNRASSGHRRAVSHGFFAPPGRPSSARLPDSPPPGAGVRRSASTRTYDAPPSGYQHRSILRERYPGDMSHRPLELLTKQNRTADKDYHRHKPRKLSDTDTIDALDTIGGTYHHGGPYDATLLSRNLNKKYSPVAAVEESNQEAIKATPQEYIKDSLLHHRPLQGTASIPPGGRDLGGNVIEYEEGADLMREPISDMGPYKQWPGIQYHPDDLKGKGEPSFTIDRDRKKNKESLDHLLAPGNYELQSGVNKDMPSARQRSASNVAPAADSSGTMFGQLDGGVRRSNTTGKRLSEGIKRRFGSLRKKTVEV